jgi:glycoside/pentoside/hexuronide:cation symporter, GPH family
VAILAVAILVSGATAPIIRNALGYPAMAGFVGALILFGALGAYAGTRGLPAVAVPAPTGGVFTQLGAAVRVADFRRLLITFGVQALAIGSLLAGVDYVARVVLGRPGASSVLFACFVGPALLVTPVWQRLADRLGKKRGYLIASLVLAVGCAGLALAGSRPVVVVYVLAAVTGIGYAGAQLFPLAMLPDTAAHDARQTGENRVGVFTGVWTAIETLGLALGPAIFAAVLALGGYRSSTGDAVTQPASALVAIAMGFSILPAALVLLSLFALQRYRLTRHEVA